MLVSIVCVCALVVLGASVDAQFVPFTQCGQEFLAPVSHSAPYFARSVSALLLDSMPSQSLCRVTIKLSHNESDPLRNGPASLSLTTRGNYLQPGDSLVFLATFPEGAASVLEPPTEVNRETIYTAPSGATAIEVLLFSGSGTGQRVVNLALYSALGNTCLESETPLCQNGGTCSTKMPSSSSAWQEPYSCTCAEYYTGHQCQYPKNYCSYTAPDGSFYDLTNQMEMVMFTFHGSYFRGSAEIMQFGFCSDILVWPCLNPPAKSSFCRGNVPIGKSGAWANARWQQLTDASTVKPGLKLTFFEDDADTLSMTVNLHCQTPGAVVNSSVHKVATQGLKMEGPLILYHQDGLENTIIVDAATKQISEIHAMHTPVGSAPYDYFCPLGKNPCVGQTLCKNGGTCWVSYDKSALVPALSAKCACPPGRSGEFCQL